MRMKKPRSVAGLFSMRSCAHSVFDATDGGSDVRAAVFGPQSDGGGVVASGSLAGQIVYVIGLDLTACVPIGKGGGPPLTQVTNTLNHEVVLVS